MDKEFFTTNEVIALLGVPRNTLALGVKRLGVAKYRFGKDGQVRWVKAEDVARLRYLIDRPKEVTQG